MNKDPVPSITRAVMPSAVPFSGEELLEPLPSEPVGVTILGSTGSIGQQTLDVLSRLPEHFKVVALAAGHYSDLLADQVQRFAPELVATHEPPTGELRTGRTTVMTGADGLLHAATHPEASIVVVATSGHAAIRLTLAAIDAGKTIALANKETIVCAGELVVGAAVRKGVQIRPVDSEHGALWQALIGSRREDVMALHLTASGGPFREYTGEALRSATAADALHHPTWHMGTKVTIDSATLMNKGLEVLEAHWLFGLPLDRIDVVVHPQSIVHSLVEFADGGQIAQLGMPDMRLPIQFALTYPRHLASQIKRLSLAETGTLTFMAPDHQLFPALQLARAAGESGGTYPTVLSAADEVAVAAFVADQIPFSGMMDVVRAALSQHKDHGVMSVEAILEADQSARRTATSKVNAMSR